MPISCVAVPFSTLTTIQAYAVWRLRQDVFVVEQQCPYPDLDGRDTEPGSRHVVLADGTDVLGCARVLDDSSHWRIGRVALRSSARGLGLGEVLMRTALAACPDRDVVLDAQTPLAPFYAGFGFELDGVEFVEDDIGHLPMRRRAPTSG